MALKHAQTAGPTPPPRPPTSIGVHRRQWPLASSLASSTSERSPIRTHAPSPSCSRLSNSEQNVAWVVQSRPRQAGQRRSCCLLPAGPPLSPLLPLLLPAVLSHTSCPFSQRSWDIWCRIHGRRRLSRAASHDRGCHRLLRLCECSRRVIVLLPWPASRAATGRVGSEPAATGLATGHCILARQEPTAITRTATM